jgi:hypothetical protein
MEMEVRVYLGGLVGEALCEDAEDVRGHARQDLVELHDTQDSGQQS